MNFDEMTLEQIEARMAEIRSIVDSKDETADFEALTAEVDKLEERKSFLVEEQRKSDILAVVEGAGEETKIEVPMEERKMDLKEIRSSKEYIDAFANYIKTNDDKQCRALLTELAQDGVVPVPTYLESKVLENWQKTQLLDLCKKTNIKGIIRIGYEYSATGAQIHVEGDKAIDEEELVIKTLEIKPETIKKFITLSDETLDMGMGSEAFLDYIYDELTQRIAEKIEEEIIKVIDNAPAAMTTSALGVPVLEADVITQSTIIDAIAKLSSKATNPVLVMSNGTWAAFKAVQLAGNFNSDIFEGITVIRVNKLPDYTTAESGETYAILGDFSYLQANFPGGNDITIKYDDLSLAEKDLVKIVGRAAVGLGIIGDACFVKIVKEAES